MSQENSGSGLPAPTRYLGPIVVPPTQAVAEGPTIRGYFAAIRRKPWVVVLFTLVGVGLSAFAITRSEQLYLSRTVIQLPEQRGSGGSGLAGLAASLTGGGGSLNAQAQVIRSRLLLGHAVDSLNLRLLREVPGFPRNRWRPVGFLDEVEIAPALTYGRVDLEFQPGHVVARFDGTERQARYGERVSFTGLSFVVPQQVDREEVALEIVPRDVAIDALSEEIVVIVRDGTNLLDVMSTGYDPIVTQRVADALAVLYRQFVTSRSRQQAERQRQFVLAQLETTEELLHATQDELTEFRRREGLYSSRAQAMMDQTGRAEIEIREAELSSERDVYASLLRRLRQGGDQNKTEVLRAIISSPNISVNPAIAARYEALDRHQLQRDSLLLGPWARSPNHGDVQLLNSLIERAEADLLALTQGHIESLDARLQAVANVRSRVDAAFQQLATSEPEEVRLMLRLESIGDAAKELRERYYVAGMAEASVVEEVTILDTALPGYRTGSGPVRSMFLGLLFGLLVGSAGAIALDSTSRAIRRRDEVESLLRVPGLGVIPPLGASTSGRGRLKLPGGIWSGTASPNGALSSELVAAAQVHSVGAEAYRTIRTNLVFSRGGKAPRSIMVSSASLGEGKTTTAANLAIAFAQQGQRVLLIDADLRRPRLHTLFRVSRTPGLAEVLTGEAESGSAVRETAIDGLFLLSAGTTPLVSAADLLSGDAVRQLVDDFTTAFDLVIVDSPPVLLTADAPILATQLDGVLLVVRAGQTERESAQYALHQLASVGAHLLGAVLNDPDATLASQRTYAASTYTAA